MDKFKKIKEHSGKILYVNPSMVSYVYESKDTFYTNGKRLPCACMVVNGEVFDFDLPAASLATFLSVDYD